MIGKELDKYIEHRVNSFLEDNETMKAIENNYDSIYTDTFSELIDKLTIVHIRYWNLEDEMAHAKTDEELARLRRKSEHLFKQKRPMLVAALDKLIIGLVDGTVKYDSVNTKKYKGWENK